MSQPSKVRVRFAPSPTGPLHMGGVRTALYNFLFAKHYGGDFLLRIEDTDQKRFVAGAESYILKALEWAGISIDEGVGAGGDLGPYRQSERSEIYAEQMKALLQAGLAYKAFDTAEEMDSLRKAAEATGHVWQYDSTTRMSMRNSLTLSESEVNALEAEGVPAVIRFRMPDDPQEVVVEDLIRGHVQVSTSVLDDKVLMKADGLPTYHFANVVDDHFMQISHVIRGEEWLPSAPLHQLLYQAFGWDAPAFAHLPLILKPAGNGKLSKRDGDQGGFPVFPLEWTDPESNQVSAGYKESGYLPEAFSNMLLMLGWNPGTDQELFSLEEAVAAFSLDRVVKSGARFNPDKAKWFNEQHLRALPMNALASALQADQPADLNWDLSQCQTVVEMMIERVSFLHEVWESDWLFQPPTALDEKLIRKRWKEETSELIDGLMARLMVLDSFDSNSIESEFKAYLEDIGVGFGAVLLPFRILLTGEGGGPSMFDFSAFLGKEETQSRVTQGKLLISSMRAQ
jgi:glutamyl-tRNA synthetase